MTMHSGIRLFLNPGSTTDLLYDRSSKDSEIFLRFGNQEFIADFTKRVFNVIVQAEDRFQWVEE